MRPPHILLERCTENYSPFIEVVNASVCASPGNGLTQVKWFEGLPSGLSLASLPRLHHELASSPFPYLLPRGLLACLELI